MDTVYIDGPLHPDLFDGETPVKVPVQAKHYKVDVEYSADVRVLRDGSVRLLAADRAEAERLAVETVGKGSADPDESDVEDVEVVDVVELDEPVSAETIRAYRQRMEAEAGAAA